MQGCDTRLLSLTPVPSRRLAQETGGTYTRINLLWMVLFVGFAGPAQAGGRTDDGSIADGSWALQFRVSNDFTLSAFTGRTLSVKHHLSPHWALRLGVSAEQRSEELDVTLSVSVSTYGAEKREADQRQYEVALDVLHYAETGTPIKLYFGGGPFADFFHDEQVRSGVHGETVERDRRSYGLRGRLGAEWFVHDHISLHAEYGAHVQWFTSETSPTHGEGGDLRIQKHASDGWSLEDAGALFGVSVYL